MTRRAAVAAVFVLWVSVLVVVGSRAFSAGAASPSDCGTVQECIAHAQADLNRAENFASSATSSSIAPTSATSTTSRATTSTATTAPSSGVRPVGNPSGVGSLTFSDEFNDSTIDPNVWAPSWFGTTNGYSRPINSSESGCYSTSQASESGGVLHLVTAANTSSDCKTRAGATAAIKSGIVSSNGKREFRYGYFESRIYLPSASNWPAWWTNGHHGTWPDRGELDVMELLSDRVPNWHVHYGSPDINRGGVGSNAVGWHTYGMRWTSTSVAFFYDGVQIGNAVNVAIPYDHYLVLNQGVKSSYANGMTAGVDMQVDYVRVWGLA